MKGLFNPNKKEAPKRGHLFSIGKTPHLGKVIEEKIKRIGRVPIPKGKHKLFKLPIRIPRGLDIK